MHGFLSLLEYQIAYDELFIKHRPTSQFVLFTGHVSTNENQFLMTGFSH